MNPAITQLFFLIGFGFAYLIVIIVGFISNSKSTGFVFSGILAIIASIGTIITYWEALGFIFLSLIGLAILRIRKNPKEKPTDEDKPTENIKPPEITGAFDKSQFNKRS